MDQWVVEGIHEAHHGAASGGWFPLISQDLPGPAGRGPGESQHWVASKPEIITGISRATAVILRPTTKVRGWNHPVCGSTGTSRYVTDTNALADRLTDQMNE